MKKTIESKFLSVSEAAKLLDVHRQTILRWVKTCNLPAHRLGRGAFRISKEALDNWVGERLETCNPATGRRFL